MARTNTDASSFKGEPLENASPSNGEGYSYNSTSWEFELVDVWGDTPVKATWAEIDTGTDDAKFATPKAIADSWLAKTLIEINAQTGTTYTLVLTDASKLVTLTNASAIALTIPTNSSVAFAVWTQIDLSQDWAGAVTVWGASVTINSKDDNLESNWQYVGLTLIKTATDTWTLYGDLK